MTAGWVALSLGRARGGSLRFAAALLTLLVMLSVAFPPAVIRALPVTVNTVDGSAAMLVVRHEYHVPPTPGDHLPPDPVEFGVSADGTLVAAEAAGGTTGEWRLGLAVPAGGPLPVEIVVASPAGWLTTFAGDCDGRGGLALTAGASATCTLDIWRPHPDLSAAGADAVLVVEKEFADPLGLDEQVEAEFSIAPLGIDFRLRDMTQLSGQSWQVVIGLRAADGLALDVDERAPDDWHGSLGADCDATGGVALEAGRAHFCRATNYRLDQFVNDPGPAVCSTPPFSDVPVDHPFCAEIEWMKDTGVSTGFDDGTYRPRLAVTRQAMSAFMARLAEANASGCTTPPFPDVPVDHPFCSEIEWMKDAGVSTGFEDGTYRPSLAVTRQAMSAFMARLAEAGPSGCTTQPFPDVAVGHPFCSEIKWMKDEGISTGFGDGTYRPAAAVTRQAMSAFLFRLGALEV